MRAAGLVAYRAASEVAGKAAFFVLTILAARRLSREGFGVFAIGTTVGWIAAVAGDFGLQMHLARTIARSPAQALDVLDRWLPVRVWSGVAAWLVAVAGFWLVNPRIALAVSVFALGYAAAGAIEFLHHFYRGLSRTDVESTLTLWHRLGALALGAAALWVRPDPLTLAVAMLIAPALTAVYSWRLAPAIA
jgi:O-antigen/teichoic acid export membrane protein